MPMVLTREQLQRRKDQAVRFTRDMLSDAGRAEEIASESLEDYAQRRGIELLNPRRDGVMARKTVAAYREELEDLRGQVGIADSPGPFTRPLTPHLPIMPKLHSWPIGPPQHQRPHLLSCTSSQLRRSAFPEIPERTPFLHGFVWPTLASR